MYEVECSKLIYDIMEMLKCNYVDINEFYEKINILIYDYRAQFYYYPVTKKLKLILPYRMRFIDLGCVYDKSILKNMKLSKHRIIKRKMPIFKRFLFTIFNLPFDWWN